MNRFIAGVSSLILLSAAAPGLAAAAHGPRLAGVDLNRISVSGAEPFWSVDITVRHLVVKDPNGVVHYAPNPGPRVTRTRAVWRTRTHVGEALAVVLTRETCSDGMSDVVYPLKADVTIGRAVYSGCAEPLR